MKRMLLCVALGVAVWTLPASAVRRIGLDIALPDGTIVKTIVNEGSMAQLNLRDEGSYGIEASIGNNEEVTVTVFEIRDGDKLQLGQIYLTRQAGWVSAGTSPSFRLRLGTITEAK